jgi:hypothetical protein
VDPNEQELIRRIHADLTDSYDEELELEIDDRVVGDPSGAAGSPDDALKESRRRYLRGSCFACGASSSNCRTRWSRAGTRS